MNEQYLTSKARPGKAVAALENIAALLLAAALVAWAYVAVIGFLYDGLVLAAHGLMLIMAVPFFLLLCWIVERKRARKHASVIVSALCMSDAAGVPCEELEKLTRVRRLHQVILDLTAKGYIVHVTVEKGVARLAERENAPANKCAMCGAALVRGENGSMQCPYCGSGAA
ncbi:MAG: hypothetical protein IJ438_10700 [Clostridia bacterium]|nr:hypothetical protein [Clostridia bacterium]